MTSLAITRHAEVRMSQRGIRETDVDFLLAHGTDVGPDRIVLTKRDAARAIRDLKNRIADIERLTGKVLVVAEGQLVTAFHSSKPVRPSPERRERLRRHQSYPA